MVFEGIILKNFGDSLLVKLPNEKEIVADIPEHYFGDSWSYISLKENTTVKYGNYQKYYNESDADRVLLTETRWGNYEVVGFISRVIRDKKYAKFISKIKEKFEDILKKQKAILWCFNKVIFIFFPPDDNGKFTKFEIIIPDNNDLDNPVFDVVFDNSNKEIQIKTTGTIKFISDSASHPFVLGDILKNYLLNLKTWCDSHTHGGVSPGGSMTSTPTPLSPAIPDINSDKIFGE